ncbi:ABC transporter ATP-binding protein, partial [Micromonospora zhanjiangensis]
VGVRRVSLTTAELPDLPGVLGVERAEGRTHLLTADADQLVRDLVGTGAAFSGLEVRPTSLEEAFLTITARGDQPLADTVRGDQPLAA